MAGIYLYYLAYALVIPFAVLIVYLLHSWWGVAIILTFAAVSIYVYKHKPELGRTLIVRTVSICTWTVAVVFAWAGIADNLPGLVPAAMVLGYFAYKLWNPQR